MLSHKRRGYVPSPYGQLHFRDHGNPKSRDAIVLLHQTAWSSVQFRGVQQHLDAAGLRSVAVDTPGYGMSDGPEECPTIEDYAEAIAPVVDHLDLDRVVIGGHHTGSSIAAALAPRLPAQLAGIVMHAPTLYTEQERQALMAMPHFDQTPTEDGSHWLKRWQFARGATAGKAELTSTHLSVSMFFDTGATEWHGHHAVFGFDLEAALKRITAPVLVISNTGDMSHEKTQRTLELRPDFEYTELAGGTVYIVYEEPDRWTPPLLEFTQHVFGTG
jgi:pimeloyl-ACP methyl ester carboxylesterase